MTQWPNQPRYQWASGLINARVQDTEGASHLFLLTLSLARQFITFWCWLKIVLSRVPSSSSWCLVPPPSLSLLSRLSWHWWVLEVPGVYEGWRVPMGVWIMCVYEGARWCVEGFKSVSQGDRFMMRTRVFEWVSGLIRVMGVDGWSGDRVDMRRVRVRWLSEVWHEVL